MNRFITNAMTNRQKKDKRANNYLQNIAQKTILACDNRSMYNHGLLQQPYIL